VHPRRRRPCDVFERRGGPDDERLEALETQLPEERVEVFAEGQRKGRLDQASANVGEPRRWDVAGGEDLRWQVSVGKNARHVALGDLRRDDVARRHGKAPAYESCKASGFASVLRAATGYDAIDS